ncbi:hypothetical protein [Geodermatophilus sp. CPCC 206100]|uniref:hypothetical protein n=1 Tax=Geodermatophilus sp. CPCC 206100 TaxID=3020054 RepID=UPI003AFFB488
MIDERELTDRLHRLAERSTPPPHPDLAATVVRRHRARRRQQAAVGAVVTVVAAAVVAVPGLVGDGGRTPDATPATGALETRPDAATGAPAEPEPGTAVTTPALPPGDVYTGPTRGSLAGDAAFVEGVRGLAWNGGAGVPDPPLAERHVVFAGDVPGGRWALVSGTNTAVPARTDPERQTDLGALSDVAVAWFVGPPGAGADEMQLRSVPYGVDPSLPSALSSSATGALVVVAAPGDSVEVSLHPDVDADGTVRRTWQPVPTADGVVVLDVGRREVPFDSALRYRVTRAGQSWVTGPDGHADPALTPPEPVVDPLREPPPPSPVDSLVTIEAQDVLARTGLAADQVRFGTVWAGDIPAGSGRTARAVLLSATLPSGAVHLSTVAGVAFADRSLGATGCGAAVLPAGTDLLQETLAFRCDPPAQAADEARTGSVVVVAPARAVTARWTAADGDPLVSVPLDGGVAVLPAPERVAQVETRDAEGRVVGRAGLLGTAGLDG